MKPTWLLIICLSCAPALAAASYPAEEAAIADRLQQLREQPPTPADRQWAESLLDYQEQARAPHPERPSLSLPRYRIRAKARALLQHWDLQAELQAWRSTPAKRRQPVSGQLQRQARALWLEQAGAAELANFRAQTDPATLDEASLLVLLRRDPQPDDWQRLLRIGGSRQTLERLAAAQDQLAPAQYAELLELAEANPRLAGHAAVLRGRWAGSRPEARERLLDELQHAPLSRNLIEAGLQAQLPELAALLSARLADPEAAPLAAWGLWRLDSPPARQSLAAYSQAPEAPAHLRDEIRRWLD